MSRRTQAPTPLEVTKRLLDEYANATQREKAEIEAALWMRAPVGARRRVREKKLRREDWVADQLGLDRGESASISRRMQLSGHGTAVGPLWDRIEKDMTITTGYSLAIEAKKTRGLRESEEEAVARVLASYDDRPVVRNLGDGKVTRHEKATALPTGPASAAKTGRRKNGGTVWTRLREIIGPYFAERLAGIEPTVVARERERFERDLQTLFEVTQSRLNTTRKDNQEPLSGAVARRRFNDGCHAIKIDPPRGPITEAFMKKAKTRFRNLAREYHPDRRGDATRPQYEAVIEAWGAIEHYYDQFVKETLSLYVVASRQLNSKLLKWTQENSA